jgi:ZIP family zinc transporter/zinc and cadmium transporter
VFDGVTIAAGFMVSASLGAILFIAVMLHKLPEGFTIASIMLAGGHSRGAALSAGAGLGVLTLAGALGTSLLAAHHVAYALAVSAGVTIYVAASDLIPEVNREDDAPGLAYTVFGGLLFFVIVDWAFAELLGH